MIYFDTVDIQDKHTITGKVVAQKESRKIEKKLQVMNDEIVKQIINK